MYGFGQTENVWRRLQRSGLIPESCGAGEEGPLWSLPARFYRRPSISMWASHCPPLLLLAFHHSYVPIAVLPSSTSPTCVCACVCARVRLDVPGAQLVMSAVGGEVGGKRGKGTEGAGAVAPVWHDSVWVHLCPWGKHTKHVPKHTALSPL